MLLIAWMGAWSSSRFFDAFKQKHVLGILRTFSDERRVLIRKGLVSFGVHVEFQ